MPESTPYVRFKAPSSLCTTGLQAQILTGVFLQLLRAHFASADDIEEPRLRNLTWVPVAGDPITPDVARTTLSIEPVYRWDPRQLQSAPAIVVKRNAMTPKNRVGIGGNEMFDLGGISKDKLPEVGREYYLPFTGSHTIFCMATEGGVAELLSTEVAREYYQFSRVLVDEFGFEFFELGNIDAVGRLEDHFEAFVVPVTFSYGFYDHWIVSKLEPRFKGVSITAES